MVNHSAPKCTDLALEHNYIEGLKYVLQWNKGIEMCKYTPLYMDTSALWDEHSGIR